MKPYWIAGMSILVIGPMAFSGCAEVTNEPGAPTKLTNPEDPNGPSSEFDSPDLITAVDEAVRDILNTPEVMNTARAPCVAVPRDCFVNESDMDLDAGLFTDRLRTLLVRAAGERLVVVAPEYDAAGTPVDFRLCGTIRSIYGDDEQGKVSHYFQITFQLMPAEKGIIVWSGHYDVKKIGQKSILYR